MAQANHEPTAPALAAHPVPSDAELVRHAYDRIADLTDDTEAICEFSDALLALGLEVEHHDGRIAGAICRVARTMCSLAEAVGAAHSELLTALHPHRHRPDLMPLVPGDDEGNAAKMAVLAASAKADRDNTATGNDDPPAA